MRRQKVLWLVGGRLGHGGTESFLMNHLRLFDHDHLQVDVAVHGSPNDPGVFDDEIRAYGGELFVIPIKSRHYLGNRKALRNLFSHGDYAVVHAHMNAMNEPVLALAEKARVPVRISHAHASAHQIFNNDSLRLLKTLAGEWERKRSGKHATHLFACSKVAGDWLFGRDNPRIQIVPNAIDVGRFRYQEKTRAEIRERYGLTDEDFVIGHIGRFDPSKNQEWLINVFDRVVKKRPEAHLLLVGDGETKQACEKQVEGLHLEERVIFSGNQSPAYPYFHAMDAFVLPSLFEGLGMAMIEAQAAGLPCLASCGVPHEAAITPHVRFITLDDRDAWVEFLVGCPSFSEREREQRAGLVIKAGYDSKQSARWLESFYRNATREVDE